MVEKVRAKISVLKEVSEDVRRDTMHMIEENVIKRMENANKTDLQSLFWMIIESLNMQDDRIIELIFRFYKNLDRKSDKFKSLVEKLVASTNR
jgi:DNA-directed RNA polymerase sigma subunit (sigma70/sigma32)